MNVWQWGRKKENRPSTDPFRRVACREPFINKWEGQLALTPALRHSAWIHELRTGYFKADELASHEIVIGYSLASSPKNFWLLYRAQYTIPKNSEAYQILEGIAWLMKDAKSPGELRMEQTSRAFHREFWPLAVERLYEEIRRGA